MHSCPWKTGLSQPEHGKEREKIDCEAHPYEGAFPGPGRLSQAYTYMEVLPPHEKEDGEDTENDSKEEGKRGGGLSRALLAGGDGVSAVVVWEMGKQAVAPATPHCG